MRSYYLGSFFVQFTQYERTNLIKLVLAIDLNKPYEFRIIPIGVIFKIVVTGYSAVISKYFIIPVHPFRYLTMSFQSAEFGVDCLVTGNSV